MHYETRADFKVAKSAPHDALENVIRVADKVGVAGARRVTVTVRTSVRSVNEADFHPGRTPEKQNADLQTIRTELPARSWESLVRVEVEWHLGPGPVKLEFTAHPDQLTDVVKVHFPGGDVGAICLSMHAAIAECFQPLKWPEARFLGLPDELRAFHKGQEETFAAREAAILEARLSLERTQNRELEAREAFRSELVAKLEDEKKALVASLEADRASLKAKEDALAKARTDLDDRQRMHARRESIKEMKALVGKQQKIVVTPETISKRRTVFYTSIAAMGGSAVLYGIAAKWLHDSPGTVFPIAMIATASVLFGSTLIYFLRWSDRWFSRHAAEEFEVRRREFALLGSANIVEMLFEWQKESEGKRDFPPELLRVLARELMPSGGTADATTHPFGDALAAFDRFRKVEVGGKHGFRLERGDESKPT